MDLWGLLLDVIKVFHTPNKLTIDVTTETYTNARSIKSNDITDSVQEINEKVPQDYIDAVKPASQLGKEACFEILNQAHRKYAEPVIIQVFSGNPSRIQQFFEYAQDKVNLELLCYAMVTGIINRKDVDKVAVKILLSHLNIYPEKYFDMNKINADIKNRNYKILKGKTGEPKAIFVSINDAKTSTNRDPNVYFAKDIKLNWHYRHWYEVNPFLQKELFQMNRSRGESFYYEHQQLLARYNFEMLCNGLPAVQPSQFNITDLEFKPGSDENLFEDLSRRYEESFISNLGNTDQKSKGLLNNILQAETALRNPTFYRLCKHMDDSFYRKKNNLKQYTDDDIRFEGINISKVEILPQILETFWEKDAINITQKLSLSQFKKVYAVHTHLQYKEFEYKIQVENNFTENVLGTVRIFLAPHSKYKIAYKEKRRTFVEMDKFVVNFTASQTTFITRKSGESSVVNGTCGWPQHLLVGKGTAEGFPCDLFVIITRNDKDETEDDRRPLGFPFDRDMKRDATEIDILNTQFENIKLTQIQIKHRAETKCSQTLKGLGYSEQ
ncbi:phenoloxidase subunit 1-like [Planococcus citri]|uniref:phenoloxidase subunit 1-like n=1 Tax=Planococcus citri TaxID=170843 RepID=UPI0031F8AE4E